MIGHQHVRLFHVQSLILVDQANTVYTLQNNLTATGTCFTVGANNVTLDCAGYLINYSQSVVGYAINCAADYFWK